MAVNVVGPAGLMSGCGLRVTLPDLPVVKFTQVTFNGSFCTSAGPGVPIAVNTYAVCPAFGPGVGIFAGPATDRAVARTLPPSAAHPLLIDGYMKSCVGGASGLKPGATGVAAGAEAAPGAAGGAAVAPGDGRAGGTGGADGTALGGAGAGAASGPGPAACTGSIPVGRCACAPGSTPGGTMCAVGAELGG